jgi:hypothetical protein
MGIPGRHGRTRRLSMARDPEPAGPTSDAGAEHLPVPRARDRAREEPGDNVDPDDLVNEPGDADEIG